MSLKEKQVNAEDSFHAQLDGIKAVWQPRFATVNNRLVYVPTSIHKGWNPVHDKGPTFP